MSIKKFTCTNGEFLVNDEIRAAFEKDGCFIVRGLLSQDEASHVERALSTGPFEEHTFGVGDGAGKEAYMVIWNHPGVDVTGMVARCEKVAGTCEKLLGGEVYHYVTKFMMKPARIGGRHVWHQDYGYWYQYGNLFPNMMTTFIAIDNATKENGCLQVLKGSHKCGRIDHSSLDGQQCADMERVEEIAKQVPLEYVELERGDALFFHCNLLHCSSANTSPSRRWAFICVYNRADNNPVKAHYHPFYTPLEKVPNSAILECQDFTTMDGKWFNDPITDNIPTGRRIGKSGQ